MKDKIKPICIAIAVICLFIGTILVCKFHNRNNILDDVKLVNRIDNTSFAMYTETESGYEEYTKDSKFPLGYKINLEKSKCLDNSGNEVNGVLNIEDEKLTFKSNKTTYCYLYFDKNAGLEIREKNPSKLSDTIKGDMYRFQGNATDEVDNYLCFGTSDKTQCTSDPDHYMYRIIGIEESGRIKVIKKEALNKTMQWYTDYVTDKKLPDSVFFQGINGAEFLENTAYVPTEWKDKISNNNWLYGDMWENDTAGAKQMGAGLYETETGQKAANWYLWSTQEEGGTPYVVQWEGNTVYPKGTTLYYKTASGKWTDTVNAKVSLMNLSDYSYSVGDEAKCNYYYGEEEYAKCKLGWIHLSQNDQQAPSVHEWTMSRNGWNMWNGAFNGFRVDAAGYAGNWNVLTGSLSVRPVFYLSSLDEYVGGTGTADDPFIIS